MSSPWYFIALWVGSKKILWKVKALLWNHLWYGSKNTARAQMSWDDYTLLKKVGGLSLTSLARGCYACTYEQVDHSSIYPWPVVELASFVEVPHHTTSTIIYLVVFS
jgi:hypothetical protein